MAGWKLNKTDKVRDRNLLSNELLRFLKLGRGFACKFLEYPDEMGLICIFVFVGYVRKHGVFLGGELME